jgi:hypothetical protein
MASDVDICNLALIAIGHTKLIQNFEEDSTEADVCQTVFEQCRDEVLEAVAWPFATRRSAPARLTATTLELGDVPDEWSYAYALPADCVPNGLRRISTGSRNLRDDEETPFVVEYDGELEQLIVLTDDDAPEFVYTARIEDTTLYSPTFVRALAERIAIELVRGLRKDAKLVPLHAQAYQAALGKAVAAAKRNQHPDPAPLPEHIAGR